MFCSDSVNRMELPASWSDSPIDVSTWEGSSEPDEQAEPLDAQIPFWSNSISSVSPLIPGNDRFALLGSLFAHIGSSSASDSLNTTMEYKNGKMVDTGRTANPSLYVQMNY